MCLEEQILTVTGTNVRASFREGWGRDPQTLQLEQ